MVDSEDEDVLFDNDLGRNLIGGKRVKNVDDVLNGGQKDKRKLRKTLALCMAFLCLGLCLAILGPTLLSLQVHLKTTLPKVSYIFAGRSLGYLGGAILGGVLFETFNPIFLIGVSLLMCGIGILLTPYLSSVLATGVSISLVGICMGCLDTGANLLCLRMWGRKRSSTMLQALHFSFAVGALLAPLLAAPFLGTPPNSAIMSASANNVNNTSILHGLNEGSKLLDSAPLTDGGIGVGGKEEAGGAGGGERADGGEGAGGGAQTETLTSVPSKLSEDRFQLAYVIIGVLVLLTSGIFFFFLCTEPKDVPRLSESNQAIGGREESKCTFRTRIIVLLFIFYFLYVGGEVAYGGFVSMFAIKSSLKFDPEHASHVAALFWGLFALGRGLAICLASLISPLKMVVLDLVGCFGASLVLTFLAESNEMAFWGGSALLGLSMASLFPSGIAWLETYTTVTGNTASFLIVGSALGEMCVPLVISYLFVDLVGPIVLMYWMLAISALSALIFCYVMWLAVQTGEKKKSVPTDKNPALQLIESVEEALPMENMFSNGGSNGSQKNMSLISAKLKRKNHTE